MVCCYGFEASCLSSAVMGYSHDYKGKYDSIFWSQRSCAAHTTLFSAWYLQRRSRPITIPSGCNACCQPLDDRTSFTVRNKSGDEYIIHQIDDITVRETQGRTCNHHKLSIFACRWLNHTLEFLVYPPCLPTCNLHWSFYRWITIYPVSHSFRSTVNPKDRRSCCRHCCHIRLLWVSPICMLSMLFWNAHWYHTTAVLTLSSEVCFFTLDMLLLAENIQRYSMFG